MNTAYFTVKHGLSYKKYPLICKLQEKNGLDLGNNYLNDKACNRIVNSISEDLRKNQKDEINGARFLSVLSDGSTDAGILEEEAVYLRYVRDGRPVTQFAGVKNPDKADAAGILKAINEVLLGFRSSNALSDEECLDEIYAKLVNCNFEGANVMKGSVTGVQTRMKERQNGLVYTHCTAHRLELAIRDAIKFDAYLDKFDDVINNIFKFYYYSPLRRKELNDLALLFEENFKQFGLLKNIRWLSSRSRALNLLESNYKILVYDLENKSYSTGETAKKAHGYINFIKTPKFIYCLNFFQDIIEKLRPLSLEFQKDELLVCHVPSKVEQTKSVIDALHDVPGPAITRMLEELNVNENNELIYKETILEKETGRRAAEVEHSPEGYKKHFEEKFENILDGILSCLDKRYADFEKQPLLQW